MMKKEIPDKALYELALKFDPDGDTVGSPFMATRPRRPDETFICGYELAAFARAAASESGVDLSGQTDDDLLALAREIAAPAICGKGEIEMLGGGELVTFARRAMKLGTVAATNQP